jgi:hypothetical protein
METDPHSGLPASGHDTRGHEPNGHEASGHEESDASIPGILLTAAGLVVTVALVIFLVEGIFWYLADHPLSAPRPNPMAETNQQQFPPVPRLDVHPTVELQEMRSDEDKILSTYGWTDKEKGIVRVPIDQAMNLRFEQGFPTKPVGKPSGGKK